MNYLFDTSALLTHLRQEAGWETVQALLENSVNCCLLASVSLPEFARRLRALGVPDAQIRLLVTDYRSLFSEVVAIDEEVAILAFEIGVRTPTRLPLIDALIAAAACARPAALAHRDEHFRAVPEGLLHQVDLGEPGE